MTNFLKRHDLDLICRAHQVVEDGYEFFAKRQLVTLFSAPNYCGEFDNAGAMMSVDETLMCSFQVRHPDHRSPPRWLHKLMCGFSHYVLFIQHIRFSNLLTTTRSTLHASPSTYV